MAAYGSKADAGAPSNVWHLGVTAACDPQRLGYAKYQIECMLAAINPKSKLPKDEGSNN